MSGSNEQIAMPAGGVRRPQAMVLLHWASLLLIALTVASVLLREGIEAHDWRSLLIGMHRSLGLFVGLLALLRILVRLRHHPLPALDSSAAPARLAAGCAHLGLYLLLLALPLLGWALSNANGQAVSFCGLFGLPALVGDDEDLAEQLAGYHQTAAWLLLGLVAVHALAALWHHFVRRDQVLRAMLPLRAGG